MRLAIAAALLLCGCGRYSDFALPTASGRPSPTTWSWQAESQPILSPGQGEDDVLNPSVARGLLFYSVFDGKAWHTALEGRRVLSPNPATWEGGYIAANGFVLDWRGELWHWYHGAGPEVPRIGLARSGDGKAWRKEAKPVLDVGPRGAWDERGVADPYVVEADGTLYLFYLGQDRARRQRLGVARSTDGMTWEKLRGNPILELGGRDSWDENGLGEPAVWQARGVWWMLYTGRALDETRRMGLARSTDGRTWQKVPGFVIEGDQAWNRKVVCDAHVEPQADGRVKVHYGGGDMAHPAERIHGRIGLGWLTPN